MKRLLSNKLSHGLRIWRFLVPLFYEAVWHEQSPACCAPPPLVTTEAHGKKAGQSEERQSTNMPVER